MADAVLINERQVVASGLVVCAEGETVTIPLQKSRIRIGLFARPGGEPSFETVADGNTLNVKLYNADKDTGSAFVTPIANLPGGGRLLMAICVHTIGQADKKRTVAYTFSF